MASVTLSLIIPTYNRADLLLKALDSIARSQAIDSISLEVIIVDNNSSDRTKDVVKLFQNKHPSLNIRYILEPRQGVSICRNKGTANARGVYVIFMDDDQQIEETYLNTVESVFSKTGATCVGGPVRYFNINNMPAWLPELVEQIGQFDAGNEIRALSPHERMLNGGNMAVDRDTLIEVGGFDESMGRSGNSLLAHADREIQHRLYDAGKIIFYTPQLIQYHDLRPDRLKKAYWRRNRFDWGRTQYRHDRRIKDTREATRLLGAPGWLWGILFKQEISSYVRSFFSMSKTERFRRELEVHVRLGHIYEARTEYLKHKGNHTKK